MLLTKIPLQQFLGDFIQEISSGFRDIWFHFNKAGRILLEGEHWQIHDVAGRLVDESIDCLPSASQRGRAHILLNSEVTEVKATVQGLLTLTFHNGCTLKIHFNRATQ